MPDAHRVIADRVRAQLERDGVDLASDRRAAQRYARDAVRRHNEQVLGGDGELITDEQAVVRDAVASLTGFGPLQPLLDDPAVEEIWINAPDRIFAARNGVTERVRVRLACARPRPRAGQTVRSEPLVRHHRRLAMIGGAIAIALSTLVIVGLVISRTTCDTAERMQDASCPLKRASSLRIHGECGIPLL